MKLNFVIKAHHESVNSVILFCPRVGRPDYACCQILGPKFRLSKRHSAVQNEFFSQILSFSVKHLVNQLELKIAPNYYGILIELKKFMSYFCISRVQGCVSYFLERTTEREERKAL